MTYSFLYWDGKWHEPVNGPGTPGRHRVSADGSAVPGTAIEPIRKSSTAIIGDVYDQRHYQAHHIIPKASAEGVISNNPLFIQAASAIPFFSSSYTRPSNNLAWGFDSIWNTTWLPSDTKTWQKLVKSVSQGGRGHDHIPLHASYPSWHRGYNELAEHAYSAISEIFNILVH